MFDADDKGRENPQAVATRGSQREFQPASPASQPSQPASQPSQPARSASQPSQSVSQPASQAGHPQPSPAQPSQLPTLASAGSAVSMRGGGPPLVLGAPARPLLGEDASPLALDAVSFPPPLAGLALDGAPWPRAGLLTRRSVGSRWRSMP